MMIFVVVMMMIISLYDDSYFFILFTNSSIPIGIVSNCILVIGCDTLSKIAILQIIENITRPPKPFVIRNSSKMVAGNSIIIGFNIAILFFVI